MELFLLKQDDPRVLDRKPYDQLFGSIAPKKKGTRKAPSRAASDKAKEKTLEQDPATNPRPDQLLSFFQRVGWQEVEKDFIQGYDTIRSLLSEEDAWKAEDDIHTTMLKYTSWKWKDPAKLKNASREYSPILGGLLFERYFIEQYRPQLLNTTPAGLLRIKMQDVLDKYVDDDSIYLWWDGVEVEEVPDEPTGTVPSKEYRKLLKAKKTDDTALRLGKHINAFERSFTEGNSVLQSRRGVPAEVAKALDMLIRVRPSLN
jgi:hypothetical protein